MRPLFRPLGRWRLVLATAAPQQILRWACKALLQLCSAIRLLPPHLSVETIRCKNKCSHSSSHHQLHSSQVPNRQQFPTTTTTALDNNIYRKKLKGQKTKLAFNNFKHSLQTMHQHQPIQKGLEAGANIIGGRLSLGCCVF